MFNVDVVTVPMNIDEHSCDAFKDIKVDVFTFGSEAEACIFANDIRDNRSNLPGRKYVSSKVHITNENMTAQEYIGILDIRK